MGVSFSAVLEYEQWGAYWALAELEISRDYELFSALAFGEGGVTDDMPYPPRGLPPDYSFKVRELFFVSPEDVKDYLAISRPEDEEETTLEEYAEGYGEWAIKEYRANGHLPQSELVAISWLNLKELKEALARHRLTTNKLLPDFRAVLAAMEVLADEFGPEKVRLLYWFGM